jgi:hypothetical protein
MVVPVVRAQVRHNSLKNPPTRNTFIASLFAAATGS